MSRPLPTHGFKWIDQCDLASWQTLSEMEGIGCILEVYLEYPIVLHDLHNDYPLAPESVTVEGSTISKLIFNLRDKTNYVVHYENLKLYENLGLKITKIYRGMKFSESAWLKKIHKSKYRFESARY